MGEQNYAIDADLKESRAMVEALVPYIYQDVLYGEIGLASARLTPGALLLRLRRLRVLRSQMNPAQAASFDQIDTQHTTIQKEWSVAYSKKLLQEVDSRLRDIHTYINECQEDPRACANAYMPEALRRTIIQEIAQALLSPDRADSNLDSRLKATDDMLRRYVKESSFIWSAILQPAYPQNPYWWLYGRPK
jgi:hypothetical protein